MSRLQGAADELKRAGNVKGLENVVERAQSHGADGGIRAGVGCHDDDGRAIGQKAHAFKGVQTAHVGHAHVHDHAVGHGFPHEMEPLFGGGRHAGVIPFLRQQAGKALAQVGVVVNNEDYRSHRPLSLRAGRTAAKLAPLPGALCRCSQPP